ncbi:MAG: asparagine synthase (glutamine-hydrolyzing) [Deltaproteobacteria bacterium HGW-Deltaproteobacteria-8]|jgi:asparagine synthase (glutamine-hydrolysing)|nr:MAG: asparagine synthase (glutamine-hydrolyzing) [Deltaproteobacteria bacterium HGW-Deltaproteobacteria-8]
MCGICGILSPLGQDQGATLNAMTTTLAHRGPDDSGVFSDDAQGIALGHRRLSILDLSPLGHQPMVSASGRFVIVFNGEIYNFRALKTELEPLGHAFRGGSDTEVLLAAFEEWGEAALPRLNGMFALALWDRKERTLLLARDRMGKKPLYYGLAGKATVFGSELKALTIHSAFDARIDPDSLAAYFRLGYIPAPQSVYSAARKLPPAHALTLRPGQDPLAAEPRPYWSATEVFEVGLAHPFTGTEEDAATELERLLTNATGLRMVADVPLGSFLSGGIDSSLVTALMQSQSARPVRTFSIGFAEGRYNEAHHAKAVAAHLGTDHSEFILRQQDLLDMVPVIPHFWDEPFADSSQIPTYAVCRLARQHVTVALSGDGGDELFNGYERYLYLDALWRKFSLAPRPLRAIAGSLAGRLPEAAFRLMGSLGPKIHWRLGAMGTRNFEDYYRFLFSHFRAPGDLVLGSHERQTTFDMDQGLLSRAAGNDPLRRMALIDHLLYLPDDILAKVDRASMAVSLEVRCPLLDHRVVEFAASLPTAFKVQNGVGKAVLRRVLYRHVPRELVDRPKMGFGVPIDLWLKDELRDWAEDLLNEQALRHEGMLNAPLVRRIWAEYLAGKNNWFNHLWDILMYQAWRLHWPGRVA